MNLSFHIFKKDFRRARPLTALWLLLLILNALVMVAAGRPGAWSRAALFEIAGQLLPALEMLLLAVFVPALILEEPLAETSAFWLSRPLSSRVLLRAKALFVLLVFLIPPLLLELAVLMASGTTLRDLALAVPQALLQRLCLILPLMLVASLVPAFGRFALVAAGLAIGVSLLEFGVQYGRSLFPASIWTVNGFYVNPSLNRSSILAVNLISMLLLGAVLIYQYRTRQTRRSIVAAALAGLLIFAATTCWRWDFLAQRLPVGRAPFDLAQVRLEAATMVVNDWGPIRPGERPWKTFSGEIDTFGVPREYLLTIRATRPHLEVEGLPAVPAAGALESGILASQEALESVVGCPIVNVENALTYYSNFFALDGETYSHALNHDLTLAADLDLTLNRYVVTARFPAARGARFDHASEHLFLGEILRSADEIDLLVQQRMPNLLLGTHERNEAREWGPPRNSLYVLRNTRRQEAVIEKWGITIPPVRAQDAPLLNRTLRIPFGPDPQRGVLTPDLTPAWLADAEVLRLELVPVCTFTKPLQPEKFKLTGSDSIKRRHTSVPPKFSKLERIPPPDPANREEVHAYIRSLEIATQGQSAYNYQHDPQTGLVQKVGHENLGLLIDEWGAAQNLFAPYLEEAIARLAKPEDKALILDSLAFAPALIRVVKKEGWVAEARPILEREISLRRVSLPYEWVTAVATFQDPATYADLVWFFVNAYGRDRIFAALRQLPGLELGPAVEEAWKRTRFMPRVSGPMVAIAAEYGHEDALDVAVDLIHRGDDSYGAISEAKAMLQKFTPATGDAKALAAWVEAHRAELHFDPGAKKFVLR